MSKYYDENGYDVFITVGAMSFTTTMGYEEYGLCGDLTVTHVVNTASEAEFTIIPPAGPIDLPSYQGQPVLIFITKNDVFEQIFSGYVSTPKISFTERKLTFKCTDDRKNRIIQLPVGIVQNIGSYSDVVFGTAKDQEEELSNRLQTVAADFDFDRYGNYYLTPWLPKDTADYTFIASDVSYEEDPLLQYTDREKTINTRNIKITYTYQRLHQAVVNVTWAGFNDFMQDYWNAGQPTFPLIATIKSAASSGDWKIPYGINTTPLWPAGGYALGTGVVIWQPNEVTEVRQAVKVQTGYLKDSTGGFVSVGSPARLVPQFADKLDAKGNVVTEVVSQTVKDTSSVMCRGASWNAMLHFAQTIVEEWDISLSAPQAIEQNGVIESSESYALTSPFDTATWEKTNNPYAVSGNTFIDMADNRAGQYNAMQVALNKARHDLLQTYRDVTLSWRFKQIQPQLDLRNTIDITCDQSATNSSASIHAKGKVYNIKHIISFKTTEAYTVCTISLSKSQGSATSSPVWFIPYVDNDPSYIGLPTAINLTSHIGLDPTKDPQSDKWTGWVCNKNVIINGIVQRTAYEEKFVVDYPAIPSTLRDDRTISASSSFTLEIPDDTLDTSF